MWDLAQRTRVIGILNVTPDSFSDGGRYADPDLAVARGIEMAAEGADAVDVGGESTRPGSLSVGDDEQIRRVVPVIRALRDRFGRGSPRHDDRRRPGAPMRGGTTSGEGSPTIVRGADHPVGDEAGPRGKIADRDSRPHHSGPGGRVRISVDTSRAPVASAAIEAGADIVNDITGLRNDPDMAPLLARTGAAVILMHMRGTPLTMQDEAHYEDVMVEVAAELEQCLALARGAGVRDDRIVLDPGIGFSKTAEQNLEILARLPLFASLGRPLLVGVSRKSFLGKVTGLPVGERVEPSLAGGAAAVLGGASLLRVHDVRPTVRMVQMLDAIRRAGRPGAGRR